MEMSSANEDTLNKGSKNHKPRHTEDTLTVILFLLPSVALFIIFVIIPILQSVFLSFYDWNGLQKLNWEFFTKNFIGFDNFATILADKVFITAIKNGFIIVALSLAIQLPLALGLAIMVGRGLPGRAFFRTVFFLPYVFSEVMTAIIFLNLFNADPDRGLINALLVLIPGVKAQGWLGNLSLVMPVLFVVMTWKYFGLYLLLYMAGLQNIPAELEEAAIIDGANKRQVLTNITIPLLGSTIRTTAYLSIIGSLQQFILVWIMTKGGPVNASEMMATYMYRYSFVRLDFGYGSAAAIIMFLVCLIVSLLYQRLFPQRDYLGGY
jgi:raffinose/stachyose/melibiose transport system permease protein